MIPASIREVAGIHTGDELDVGCSGGLIVMRKRVPLTAERVRSLLRRGRTLPEMAPSDEKRVAQAIGRVRSRASG